MIDPATSKLPGDMASVEAMAMAQWSQQYPTENNMKEPGVLEESSAQNEAWEKARKALEKAQLAKSSPTNASNSNAINPAPLSVPEQPPYYDQYAYWQKGSPPTQRASSQDPAADQRDGMESVGEQQRCPDAGPPQPPPGTVSPALERRNHHGGRTGVLGKIRSFTNRSSYSTSEEGHSSDCEEPEDVRPEDPHGVAVSREYRHRSSSSFAGKVRDLHRDVKRRISKLRGTNTRTVSDSESRDHVDSVLSGTVIQAGSSVESIPSGSGGSRTSLQGHTPTSSNRSSSSAGEEDTTCNSVIGPILGRARALVDVTPSPYDRDALGFKKGDLIDIIAKNKTGTWIGVLNGKVGHFKFINVQEISDMRGARPRRRRCPQQQQREMQNSSSAPLSTSTLTRPQSLEQLLEQNGLQDCVNVLMLHGYEDLETFKEISREDLASLGIIDNSVQGMLLRAADSLADADDEAEEFPEDWTEPPVLSNHRIVTSNLSVEEEDNPYPTNNLDARDIETHILHNNTHHRQLPPQSDLQEGRTTEPDEFHPNIPASQEDEEETAEYPDHNPTNPGEPTISLLQTTAQILKQSGYDSEGCSVPYPIWREDYYPENGHHRNNGKVPPPIPKRTTPPITRPSKLVNGLDVNGGSGIYYAPEEVQTSTTRSATLPRKKIQENEQQQPQPQAPPQSRGLEKKLYKKLTQRKTSLQNALANNKYPRPPSLSLLTAVCRKLEDEGIDLGQDPYTDKTGFCGIPPALVQRYAEELQRDVYDVAEAMDQARINSLQIRGRRGVPNDFLADSCYGPVVEANYRGLREWLISLGLPMYEADLSTAGFDHLASVAGMRDSDLCGAGIHNARHIRLLTTAIGALNIHFGRLMCP